MLEIEMFLNDAKRRCCYRWRTIRSHYIKKLCYNRWRNIIIFKTCWSYQRYWKRFTWISISYKDAPQTLINVKVDNAKKNTWDKNEKITNFIAEINKKHSDEVRILVRKSGTEPLIRVMTEGENKQLVHKLAEDIAKLIETELN